MCCSFMYGAPSAQDYVRRARQLDPDRRVTCEVFDRKVGSVLIGCVFL